VASGLRVPVAVGDFMILDAVRESEGQAVSVDESRLLEWLELGCRTEGISFCPETAACLGAVESLTQSGWISSDEKVVVFNTGAGQKYLEAMATEMPKIDLSQPMDWDAL
jgi:threonine synthase